MTFDIFLMQAFNGLSLSTILVLMALGLAIVFGLMGVINMAHGELMAMGAYTTYATALFFDKFMPALKDIYFLIGIVFAFAVTFAFGFALERGLIRFLYKRPLDTMLATWGLSLILQQVFRHVFGPKEVGYVYAYVGFLGIILQGKVLGMLVKKFGEKKVVWHGFFWSAISAAVMGYAFQLPVLYVASGALSPAQNLLFPGTLAATISDNDGLMLLAKWSSAVN